MNNWQEQFKTLFGYASRQEMVDFIATLLEKQREEYVEMIKKYKLEQIDKFDGEYSLYLDDIINLIKPHDKTS